MTIANVGAIRILVAAPLATGTVLDLIEWRPGDTLRVIVSGTKLEPIGTGMFERLLAAHPNVVQVAIVPELPTRLLFAGMSKVAMGAARCC